MVLEVEGKVCDGAKFTGPLNVEDPSLFRDPLIIPEVGFCRLTTLSVLILFEDREASRYWVLPPTGTVTVLPTVMAMGPADREFAVVGVV